MLSEFKTLEILSEELENILLILPIGFRAINIHKITDDYEFLVVVSDDKKNQTTKLSDTCKIINQTKFENYIQNGNIEFFEYLFTEEDVYIPYNELGENYIDKCRQLVNKKKTMLNIENKLKETVENIKINKKENKDNYNNYKNYLRWKYELKNLENKVELFTDIRYTNEFYNDLRFLENIKIDNNLL